MNLTFSEIKSIRECWEPVYKDPEGNGGLILKTFLDKHEYYNKFPRFKDAPRDTILQNPIFRNHAAQLMFIINEAIENIEEPDVLKDKLNALGKAHAKRNIKPLQFEQLKVVILDILKKTLKLRDEDHKAFVKMFDGLLPFIFEGMKK